jgi:NADH:ubiquinone oxidoreductase subunit 5 (subunit L)/multisubunit Na+/H+ antiporter MnhA subunit
MGSRRLCFLHLICHGFVKANLFLCVGTVIHSNYGSQEIRACRGPTFRHPFLLLALLVSALSLRGLFFLTCYASKHLIVLSLLNTNTSIFFGLLLHAGLVLSVAYSWRLVLFLLRSPHRATTAVRGRSSLTIVPIRMLSLPSICAGPSLSHLLAIEARSTSLSDALVPTIILLLGFLVGELVGKALLSVDLGPFTVVRRLSYATLWCAAALSPVKTTETGPLSPLFYKGILSSGLRTRGTRCLSFSSLFLSGIIITVVLAL